MENVAQEQILTEMRSEHQAFLAFGDALDAKLNTLLGSSSLLIALFAILGATSAAPVWYWLVVIGVTVIYLGGLIWVCAALQPTDYMLPIKANWDHIASTYFPLPYAEQIDYLISQHIVAIAANKIVLERKARAVRIGLWALLVALIILLANRMALSVP